MSRHATMILCALFLLTAVSAFGQAPPANLHGRFHDGGNELDWDHPSGDRDPVYYKVYRATGLGGSFSQIGSTTHNEFFEPGVALGTLYLYKVTALYSDSTESLPATTSIFTGAIGARPAPPRELEAEFQTDHVNLRWMRPMGDSIPSSYRVYRAMPMNMPVVLGTTTDTSYTDNSIALNTHYVYAVTAMYHDTVESLPSYPAGVYTGSDSSRDSGFVMIHFTTTPPHTAQVNQLFQYDADVTTMPAGVPVCFRLGEAPDGMTIDNATGLIQWTPAHGGIFEVEIKARPCDGSRGWGEQEFRLLVVSGKPGSVSGTVRNTTGDGVGNVSVRLFDVAKGEFVMRTESDNTGRYAFPYVDPTTYLVRAKPETRRYLPQWYNGAAEMHDATPVTVPESTSVTVDFVLANRDTTHDRFVLTGTVRDSAGNGLRGANVGAFRERHDQDPSDMFEDDHDDSRGARTDSNGAYRLVLRTGTYIIGAEFGHLMPQFWDHKGTPLEADRLTLVSDTSGIDFDLVRRPTGTGSISGSIKDARDSTALRSHVIGFQRDGSGHFTGYVTSTHTDTTGAYTLGHLPNGSYIVLAKAEHDFVPTFYNGGAGTPFLDSALAVAVSGGPVTGIDIYPGADSADGLNSISGHVNTSAPPGAITPDAAVPLAGAIVTVTDGNRSAAGYAVSGTDGAYSVPGLAPDTYTVTFQKPGQATVSVPVTLAYQSNQPMSATIDAQLVGSGSGPMGTFAIRSQWNLISVPVAVADMHRTALFPTAISQAFSFSGSGYSSYDMLDYSAGYWMKFPNVQILSLAGTERMSQSISLSAGWNLIGSLSSPVPVSSIQMSQTGLISSNIFGYSGGYSLATTLQPGQGYWVKANAAGTITLTSGSAQAKDSPLLTALNALNSLTIKDAAGHAQTLWFGPAGSSTAQVDLPPTAPDGAFDVRFASQRIAETHEAGLIKKYSWPIAFQGVQGQVTVSWSVRTPGAAYTLTSGSSGTLTLKGNGSGQLSVGPTGSMTLGAGPSAAPKEFALRQNYPNPFNPTTTITFDLPVASNVTLKIYNIIGQEVATIYNNVPMEAGIQTAQFDASRLASGMYFYKLQAGTQSGVRKMLLLR